MKSGLSQDELGRIEQSHLIDTNILKPTLKSKANLPLISKIERLSWEKDAQVLLDFVQHSLTYPLEKIVINRCIGIREKHRIKVPDAMISATAIAHGLRFVTRNVSDFKKIGGIKRKNPFEF